jgi:hypothetical protein
MVNYCPTCNKRFDDLYNFKNHINRQIKCKPIEEKLSCGICSKKFTQKKNLVAHCNTKHIGEPVIAKKELSKMDLISNEPLPQQIEYNNCFNTTNNITVNINLNIDEKSMKKIMINPYGKENTEYITKHFLDKLLQTDFPNVLKTSIESIVNRLINEVHFNPDHPENMNIKLKSLRNKKEIEVLESVEPENKWVNYDTDSFISRVILDYHNKILEHLINNTNLYIPCPYKAVNKDNLYETAINYYTNEVLKIKNEYEYEIRYTLDRFIQKEFRNKSKQMNYYKEEKEKLKNDANKYGSELSDNDILTRFKDDLEINLDKFQKYQSKDCEKAEYQKRNKVLCVAIKDSLIINHPMLANNKKIGNENKVLQYKMKYG